MSDICLPSPAAAEPTTLSATKTRSGLCLSPTLPGDCLTDDYDITFLQISRDDFRCRSIAQSNRDATRLRFAILAKYPHQSCLTTHHRSCRWCQPILILFAISISISLRAILTLTTLAIRT